jgi:GTP-binding protein
VRDILTHIFWFIFELFWPQMARIESEFLLTLADVSQFPDIFKGEFLKGHREPRIAVVGRSNVGKSTLINALLGKRLAYTSSQPGKTRAIHFYHWKAAGKIIADLPGYGFAKTSKLERDKWEKLIGKYLEEDENLDHALVLLDARHGPTDSDLQAIDFLSFRNLPVTLVFTKVDTLKTQSERIGRKREAAEALKSLQNFDGFCGSAESEPFWVSCRTGAEIKQLIQHIKSGVVKN